MAVNVPLSYVWNNAIITIDGEETEINGYLQGISFDTGKGAEHIQTLNQLAHAIGTNLINDAPSGSLIIAPGMFKNFYTFLNGRKKFELQINEYTTGYLEGETHLIQVVNCQLSGVSGDIGPMRPASTMTVNFIATQVIF